MYTFVCAKASSYIYESSTNGVGELILKNAYRLQIGEGHEDDTAMLAKSYIKAKIGGRLRTIRLSIHSIEAEMEIEELDSLITAYSALIPLAEKRARAEAIFEAWEKLRATD